MEKFNKQRLISYFLTDNTSGYKTRKKHIEKNFSGLLEEIENFNKNSEFEINIPLTQKLYNFLHNICEKPMCETCGKEIKWRNRFSEGYLKNCSKTCRSKSKKRLERIKETNLKKYGYESISQVNDIKEKRKETYFNKFGTKNIFESKEIIEKTKNTNLKKYGTEYPIQSEKIKNKRKINNLKIYGVDSTSKLNDVKNKTIETNLKKYGSKSVMQNEKIKQKYIESVTKKTIDKYKKILGSHVNIINDGNFLIINNQCQKHKSYKINRTLFYYRVLFYNIKNPCILCNPVNYYSSIKENEIKFDLENELNIKFKKIRIKNKEIDFYHEKHKIGIEFNGLYWHSEINKTNDYHYNKTLFFKKNNIDLIHVFEDEWAYKKDIVRSIIKSKFGFIENKIYARKCVIKNISDDESKNFLEKNHIQGNVKSKTKLGLYYNNELVSLMTFGKIRKKLKNNNETIYELYRFCNKLNTTVIGGASKLLSFFIKNHNPEKIISYADRRYSNGNLYKQLGFKFISETPPNYWYFKKNEGIRYHRFNYRKSVLVKQGYDPLKTEHEIMLERGYLRIYDSGNLKFELIF